MVQKNDCNSLRELLDLLGLCNSFCSCPFKFAPLLFLLAIRLPIRGTGTVTRGSAFCRWAVRHHLAAGDLLTTTLDVFCTVKFSNFLNKKNNPWALTSKVDTEDFPIKTNCAEHRRPLVRVDRLPLGGLLRGWDFGRDRSLRPAAEQKEVGTFSDTQPGFEGAGAKPWGRAGGTHWSYDMETSSHQHCLLRPKRCPSVLGFGISYQPILH